VSESAEVLIVGAGVAGLAAAVALSGAGAKVTLLERKPYVGGRAYSYMHPALDEVIDSQHVMLGCCTNLIDLCRMAGADRHIRWYDDITFLEPETGGHGARASVIGPSGLPAPGHSGWSFLRAPMLEMGDKARIAAGMMEFLRGYPAGDDEAFSAWLKRTKQTERGIRHFWEPLILATVNDTFENCSTRYAGKVIHEVFLASPEGGRLGIPTQPLSEFYSAVAELAERQGTELRLRTSVERIERAVGGGWSVTASDGATFGAQSVVLALPFEQTAKLLGTLPEEALQRRAILPMTQHFKHAPITTIHLWFDRAVTEMDHVALLDTRIQWMFNKTRIRREEPSQIGEQGQYLELVISGSFAELHQTREEILGSAMEEIGRFFPVAREANVVKSGVLKEARATFSVTPGLDAFRPAADAGDGLYLAGDWTRTDWPATMEGGVRSGRLAAEAVARSGGEARAFLSPELESTGFMRLFKR
jgi:squalene-associated FAD-dependent desaturase